MTTPIDMKQLANDTDSFMRDFKEKYYYTEKDGSLTHKVIFLYEHFYRIEHFLSYSYDVHLKFWQFIQKPVSREAVIDWFSSNINEWSGTKYGLTNGKIDWYTGGCFAENTIVKMHDGTTQIIKNLNKGDVVYTPLDNSFATVLCVVKWRNPAKCILMPESDLLITPYHPIMRQNIWEFPIDTVKEPQYFTVPIYNLILDKGHNILVDDTVSCTLGHGFTDNNVISHPFFGTSKVIESIKKINSKGWDDGFVYINAAVRDLDNNRVIDFV